MHVQDTIDRLKKGQNVQGRVMPGRGGRGKPDSSRVRGILKRPGVVSSNTGTKNILFIGIDLLEVNIMVLWTLFRYCMCDLSNFPDHEYVIYKSVHKG